MNANTSLSPLLATVTARAELPQPFVDGLRKRQAETTYPARWATCGYISNNPSKRGAKLFCARADLTRGSVPMRRRGQLSV